MTHQPSIYCILPPHLLLEIIQNGSPIQRAIAIRTFAAAEQVRAQRRTMKSMQSLVRVLSTAGKHRNVYDAKQGSQLPGTLVRVEGGPPVNDIGVNEAYDGAGTTYDLFYNIYSRNSVDNNGLVLNSTVHYQKGYDNAFWNGEQMVYGDGDEDLPESERLFNRFTIALDVIGHELTHGITQFEADLAYWEQPGALNESFSDVFGSLVKQYQRQQTADQADWIIGEGLFSPNVKGVGIRSMKAPGTAYDDPILGKDPQPAHMTDYVTTVEDNGGVHINSGIPNHAFYVTAITIGGNSWEKAGRIWYRTMADKLSASSKFQDAADLSFEAAGELYGKNSPEQEAVRTGWAAVGITIGGNAPGGCLPKVLRWMGITVPGK